MASIKQAICFPPSPLQPKKKKMTKREQKQILIGSYLSPSCYDKIPQTRHFFFQFWQLEGQGQDTTDSVSGESLIPYSVDGYIFTVSSCGGRGEGTRWGLFHKGVNPSCGLHPIN